MARLTVNVDSEVASRAKQYAKLRGVSLSKLVEAYLSKVTAPSSTPILDSIRGILKTGDIRDYRKYLESKYG